MTPVRILRRDNAGEPDDVVVSCTLFRLERMDRDSAWIGVYDGEGSDAPRVCFSLRATKRGKLKITVYDDQLGLRDDFMPTLDEPSPALIERAAKAAWVAADAKLAAMAPEYRKKSWDEAMPIERDVYREEARAILTAFRDDATEEELCP